MWIKFRPITRINKWIKGRTVTLFYPSRVYEGFKNTDGSIVSSSPKYDKPVKINENDIMIVDS